jgi:hypothetical protein
MTFWRIVTIHLRSRTSRYDGVHAGYRYFQLHHQAPTGETLNLRHFSNVPGLKVEVWS